MKKEEKKKIEKERKIMQWIGYPIVLIGVILIYIYFLKTSLSTGWAIGISIFAFFVGLGFWSVIVNVTTAIENKARE